MAFKAIAFNCMLRPSDEPSSTELLLSQIMKAMKPHGIDDEIVRVVDHDIKPGVSSDEGRGDAWPPLRKKVLTLRSSFSARRSGSASHRVCVSACWNEWMPSSARLTM
jgi:hypothetical protein